MIFLLLSITILEIEQFIEDVIFITLQQFTKERNWLVLLRLTKMPHLHRVSRKNFGLGFCRKRLSKKNLSSCVIAKIPIHYCDFIQDSSHFLIMSKSFVSKKLVLQCGTFILDHKICGTTNVCENWHSTWNSGIGLV